MRLGNLSWSGWGRHEDLQLVHLLPWPEWPEGSQEVSAGFDVGREARGRRLGVISWWWEQRARGGNKLCSSTELGMRLSATPSKDYSFHPKIPWLGSALWCILGWRGFLYWPVFDAWVYKAYQKIVKRINNFWFTYFCCFILILILKVTDICSPLSFFPFYSW